MNDAPDHVLIARYAERGDEAAFRELVRRHVDAVHSAARRMLVDPHLAEDAVQSAFAALARQSGDVALRVRSGMPLSAWLHQVARNVAAKTVRTEERRRAREQEAAMMQSRSGAQDDPWTAMSPHLDAALADLPEPDRHALCLRYFERLPAREVGLRLGVGEEAAQKRIARALERLRDVFVRRGLAVPAGTFAGIVAANAVQPAPAAVAALAAAAPSVATPSGIAPVLAMNTSAKAAVTVSLLLSGALAIALVAERRRHADPGPGAPTVAAEAPAPAAPPAEPDPAEHQELLRLRGEVARLRAELAAATNRTAVAAGAARPPEAAAKSPGMEAVKTAGIAKMTYLKDLTVALIGFASEHGDQFPDSLEKVVDRLPDAAAQVAATAQLDTAGVELVFHGKLGDIGNPAQAVIIRERTPWPVPGRAGLSRTYAFADGHSEIHRAEDGDFDRWEAEHLPAAKPAPPGNGQP